MLWRLKITYSIKLLSFAVLVGSELRCGRKVGFLVVTWLSGSEVELVLGGGIRGSEKAHISPSIGCFLCIGGSEGIIVTIWSGRRF